MHRVFGALVAAVALMAAGSAGAQVLEAGVVGDSQLVFVGAVEPRGGSYEFRTTGKVLSYSALGSARYRSYGGSLDGVQIWGSSNFSQVPLPDTVPAPIITTLADGFRIQFYTPPSVAIVSPTGCYLNEEHCGYYHNYDYLAELGIEVIYAPGQEGATYTLTRISSAAVPEPATWAIMIVGFGLTGSAIRRRVVRSHRAGIGRATNHPATEAG